MADFTAPAPPLPPGSPPTGGPPSGPSLSMLSGNGNGPGPANPGQSQIGGAAIRLSMEIDQTLKLLAQAMPTLSPWVEKTTLELRYQIGQALQNGAVPTSPASQDNKQFPDGGGQL